MNTDIHDIKTWPPGALMGFDNRAQLQKHPVEARRAGLMPHNGVGIIVYNDGKFTVNVVWGSNCKDGFCEYDVRNLNTHVVSRIG